MVPLVAVSGAECVDALVLAGFTVRSRNDDTAILVKELRSIAIPLVAMLTPDELTRILRDAGLAYSEFLDCLSETPTEPDLRRTTGTRRKSAPRAATG
jgi:hypothetical protein